MELDENLMKDNSNLFYNYKSAYIIQYPKSKKVKVSYGIIGSINNYELKHFCSTESGSSGSPILNLSNNKIIGIHKGCDIKFEFNIGIFLKYPIKEFITQIELLNQKYLNKNDLKKSDIIKNKSDLIFIISSLIKKINISKIKLIYKATIHGDTGKKFKECCNYKGLTITLIKSEKGEIFGGFTKCDWTNENFKYSYDDHAFLISITNKKIFNIIEPKKAIINYEENYAFASFGNSNNWDGLYFFDGFLDEE